MFSLKKVTGLWIAFALFSCQEPKANAENADYYFSLTTYFEKEAKRLGQKQPAILKQISRNSLSESKKIDILDWESEFGLFIASDINKQSWKDAYQIITIGDTTHYKSLDTALRTQQIILVRKGQVIEEIKIRNAVSNRLYRTTETLSYFPDSMYSIQKDQYIRFLGTNQYEVNGYFNR